MNLSPVYVQRLEEAAQQGIRQGRRDMVENFLRVRFDTIDQDLSTVIEPLLQLPSEESARLLLQLSREELLARFGTSRN